MSKATFDIDPELQSKVKGSQIVPSGTMEEKVTKVAYRSTGTIQVQQQAGRTIQYSTTYCTTANRLVPLILTNQPSNLQQWRVQSNINIAPWFFPIKIKSIEVKFTSQYQPRISVTFSVTVLSTSWNYIRRSKETSIFQACTHAQDLQWSFFGAVVYIRW